MIKKRIAKTLAVMAFMLCAVAVPAMAQSELDQSQTTIDSYWGTAGAPVSQTFTAQKTGALDKVSVWMHCEPSANWDWFFPCDYGVPEATLEIKGTQSDPPAQRFAVSPGDQWYDVPLDPAPFVEAGKQYEIRVSTWASAVGDNQWWGGAASDVYPGGEFTYYDVVTDQWTTGNERTFKDMAFRTYVTPDTTAPKVDSTDPAGGASGVARATDVTANFSEKMDTSTLNSSTFRLFKVNPDGITKRITDAPVTPSADGLSATLDPFGSSSKMVLAKKARYKAVVTTGAEDLAGNALDQNAMASGDQNKAWYFTTGGN